MVVNIEDAGFEIRDQIMWLYGSGFPKSHNIGKSVDKLEGNERDVVGEVKRHDFKDPQYIEQGSMMKTDNSAMIDLPITKGQSDWEGWGTGLKPANEPICLARKPLSEKSVALNVLKWATGGINIDGCRIGFLNDEDKKNFINDSDGINRQKNSEVRETYMNNINIIGNHNINDNRQDGRFPANIIFECICDEVIKGEKGEIKEVKGKVDNNGEIYGGGKGKNSSDYISKCIVGDKGDIHTNPNCPCNLLDEQSGFLKSGSIKPHKQKNKTWKFGCDEVTSSFVGDSGGASRFFYQAKVSKAERNMGLDGFEDKENKEVFNKGFSTSTKLVTEEQLNTGIVNRSKVKNNHPTVKPINLMTYLCRLITPKGGVVLDPFMGSGSSGIAALLEGFDFIGMEMDEDYFKIAEGRIKNYEQYKKFIK
jgi:site-specific DNA-methyltransferase (adenine-specific)